MLDKVITTKIAAPFRGEANLLMEGLIIPSDWLSRVLILSTTYSDSTHHYSSSDMCFPSLQILLRLGLLRMQHIELRSTSAGSYQHQI